MEFAKVKFFFFWLSVFSFSKLVALYTKKGLKSKAYKIVIKALQLLHSWTKMNPFFLFLRALFLLKVSFQIRLKRKGSVMFLVPFPVFSKKKQLKTALRFLLLGSLKKKPKSDLSVLLASNILLTVFGNSVPLNLKRSFLNQVMANRAFLAWRW